MRRIKEYRERSAWRTFSSLENSKVLSGNNSCARGRLQRTRTGTEGVRNRIPLSLLALLV